MLKRNIVLILSAGSLLTPIRAQAQVVLPHNFTANTSISASQMMANLNAIVSGVNTGLVVRTRLAPGPANTIAINDGAGALVGIGVLPIAMGGSGANNVLDARTNLGLGTAAVANIGIGIGNVMGADAVPVCAINQKLQMSTGPNFIWSCVTDSGEDITKLPLAGGTMTGVINMNNIKITNLAAPTEAGDAVNKNYVDTQITTNTYWTLSGGNIYRGTGWVGIGTTIPEGILDISSTTSGLILPRMTQAQRDAMAMPRTGMQMYNTTSNQLNFYDGSVWQALGVAGSGLTSLNGITTGAQTFANGATGTAPAWFSSGSTHILNIPMAADTAVTAGLISKNDYDNFNAREPAVTAGTTTQYYRGDKSWADLTSTVVPEGTNLYFTDTRARSALSAVAPLSYNPTTGALSISGSINSVVTTSVSGAYQTLTCADGQVLGFSAGGPICQAGGSANAFVQDGNSFGAPAVIGTNDNQPLHLETNGTTKLSIQSNGLIQSYGGLSMMNNRISMLAGPENSDDAATKGYVDSKSSLWQENGATINTMAYAVGVGTNIPQAALQIDSTTSGLLIPRLSTFERDNIGGGAPPGLQIYNTDSKRVNVFNAGDGWREVQIKDVGFMASLSSAPAVNCYDSAPGFPTNYQQLSLVPEAGSTNFTSNAFFVPTSGIYRIELDINPISDPPSFLRVVIEISGSPPRLIPLEGGSYSALKRLPGGAQVRLYVSCYDSDPSPPPTNIDTSTFLFSVRRAN
jgi:hypothetical protein